jgi:hypothetical protein
MINDPELIGQSRNIVNCWERPFVEGIPESKNEGESRKGTLESKTEEA